ncbi:hypothetical protein BZG36_00800 [Bifiguratus adelaidae]|uniref:Vacuolar protein sorting-associated protein n=1 Tax=Bifiguratus adelaidae TaxID=1938954 RepID=A0A261Y6M6_9FUNG|nr:hypothetical protein BZG36_00800 [Bifiguratus adelaidae]
MLESVVVNVLNRILGAYVSNLNYNQLNIGIWSGDVVLKNLKLKREALDKLDLPIDVLEGHLGTLTLNIPWNNLKNKPVKIYVDDVYLLAIPRVDDEMSPEELQRRAQTVKLNKLANAELMAASASEKRKAPDDGSAQAANGEVSSTFLAQLTTKIVDNLQISINHIHVRYEDTESDVDHPFAVGFTLREFSAVSTDEEWNPVISNMEVGTIHKLITLEAVSAYWDTDATMFAGLDIEEVVERMKDMIPLESDTEIRHQHVLKPVSGTGRVKMHKKFGGMVPKADATLLFNELGFVIDDDQFRDVVALIALFHSHVRRREFIPLRPKRPATPRTAPLAFFRYAGQSILASIHERHYRWSWEHFAKRRDQRKEYVELYIRIHMGKAQPGDDKKMEELEIELSYEDIRFYRSIAKQRLRRERALMDAEAKLRASQRPKQQTGWLSGWWGASANTADDEAEPVMNDEQRQELYDAIDYDEDKAAIAAAVDFPRDTIMLSLCTKLKRGSFSLRQDPHGMNKELVSLVFSNVTTDVVRYPNSMIFKAALGDLRLTDHNVDETLHPQLVKVKEDEAKLARQYSSASLDVESSPPSARSSSPNVQALGWQDLRDEVDEIQEEFRHPDIETTNPFFSLVVEHKPLDERADNAVAIKMRHLEIIYNPKVVRRIIDFFTPPESGMESINALIDYAGDTFEGLKAQTKAGLEFALDQHTTLDVKVDMNAPIIIIPEDCNRNDSLVLLIDAGHINVESNLARKEDITDLKRKHRTEYSKEDYDKLASYMYDRFTVQLSKMKALVGQSVTACLEEVRLPDPESDLEIVDQIDMQFLVEMCILPKATNMTRLKVSGELPLLSLNFSDRKYRTIMTIIDLVLPRADSTASMDRQPGNTDTGSLQANQRERRNSNTNTIMASTLEGYPQRGIWTRPREILVDSLSEIADSDDDEVASTGQSSIADSTDLTSLTSTVATRHGTSRLEHKLFEFSFKVGKVSASLRRAHRDFSKKERLLCDLVLQNFVLEFTQREYDMTVRIRLASLNVVDKMTHGSDFGHLISSDTTDDAPAGDSKKDLVELTYVRVNRQNPEYATRWESNDQILDIALSTLNIVLTRSSILTLYNYILTTFAPNMTTAAAVQPGTPRLGPSAPSNGPSEPSKDATGNRQSQIPSQNLNLKVSLDSVNLVCNNDGVRLATARLSHGEVFIFVGNNTVKLGANLGNFNISNDLKPHGESEAYFPEFLTVEGSELVNFRFDTFNPQDIHYPGYDQKVFLRMGSAHFTFQEEPLRQLLDFGSKFAEMYSLYERARKAAVQSAAQLQEAVTKVHFDVIIHTPVITFASQENRHDVAKAYLGEISAKNNFEDHENATDYTNVISAGIRSIRLVSDFQFADGKRQVLPIVEDVDITFDVRHDSTAQEYPSEADVALTDIKGFMSDVKIHLTAKQYKFVMELITSVGSVFASSSPEDDGLEQIASDSEDDDEDLTSIVSRQMEAAQRVFSGPGETNDGVPQVKFKLDFIVSNVVLDMYLGDASHTKSLADAGLSVLSLNQTLLNLRYMSDSSLELAFEVESLTIKDTRTNVKTKFREIMPAVMSGDPQFVMKIDISPANPDRHILSEFTVNNPKIILSLEHVFLLYGWIMVPFQGPPSNPKMSQASHPPQSSRNEARDGSVGRRRSTQSKQSRTPPAQQQQQGNNQFTFTAMLNNGEIILLANPLHSNSEAVVLSSKRVTLSQQAVFALAFDKIGMFLCRMDRREQTSLRFIETFDCILTMDNRMEDPNQPTSDIVIDVQPLILRLSYRDALLILDIFNKASELSGSRSDHPDGKNARSHAKMGMQAPPKSNEIAKSSANTRRKSSLRSNKKPTKESLTLAFQKLQLILIEDVHELPLIDMNLQPSTVRVSDWSIGFVVDTQLEAVVNFFDVKNSHWEPLLEPWNFRVKFARQMRPEKYSVELYSEQSMELNLTHVFIETAMNTVRSWDEKTSHVLKTQRGSVSPYLIENRTGYTIHLWGITDNRSTGEMSIIEDGSDLSWSFDDWRKRRESTYVGKNMLGLQIEGPMWESLKNVPVDREGTSSYILRPKVNKVSHRLIVETRLKDNVKIVTLRSTLLVENRTLLPVDVMMVNAAGEATSSVYKVAPGQDFAVPIEMAYHGRICVRPDAGFGYDWSAEKIYWADIAQGYRPHSLTCTSVEAQAPPFRFQVHGRFDAKNPSVRTYPTMSIRLSAPIEIENLLPYDFNFRIVDKNTRENFTYFLRNGGTSPLHVVEMGHLLLLNIELRDTEYGGSEFAIISSQNEDLSLDDQLVLTDRDNLKLHLRINSVYVDSDHSPDWKLMNESREIPESGGAYKFSVYAPYVILNKTGLPMRFMTRSNMQTPRLAAGQATYVNQEEKVMPFMFSYPKTDKRNRCIVQIGQSEWSEAISFEAAGSVQEVVIPSASKSSEEIHLGVSVQEGSGKFKLTKVVTFTSRFILKNNSKEDLNCREPGTSMSLHIPAGEKLPIHFMRRGQEKYLTIQYPGLNNAWSAPFNIREIGKIHVKLSKSEQHSLDLIRVDVLLEDATIFVISSKEEGKWPYRIDNLSSVDVTFYQQEMVPLGEEFSSSSRLSPARKKYRLPAGKAVKYSWDYPAMNNKALMLHVNGRERLVNIQEIGNQVPFKYPIGSSSGIMSIDVTAEGLTQVLRLTDFRQSESLFRPNSMSSTSSQDRPTEPSSQAAKEGFRMVDVQSVTSLTFQVRLARVGVSIINKQMKELLYATAQGVNLTFSDSTVYQSLRAEVKWLQIDNQIFDTIYPILLYPSIVDRDENTLPTFQFAVHRVKDDSHGVMYIKYFSVLLQEMNFEMDEDFLYALLDFTKLDVAGWSDIASSRLCDEMIDIPEPKSLEGESQLYFEYFNLQPCKLNISFVRTEHMTVVDERPAANLPVMFFLNVLTMAIGNINDAPIKLNALVMENVKVSGIVLLDRIQKHYGEQFFYQLHNIIGSADFLGNPVGLFNTLSTGVQELFYEPYQGAVMSDKPQDLGLGIARGVGGFFKKSVYGFSDSFSKVTGSIGKGLSAATFDTAYQDRRRMNMARNRPKHAIVGVRQGAESFANSVMSGVTGLVKRPIEGVEKDGLGGFFTGFGRGIAGALTKPVVGVFDLASNVSEGKRLGIRNTAVDTNDIDRVRLPRFIGKEGILKPYDAREAQGQSWLRELTGGKYFDEEYLGHCEVQGPDLVVLLTYARIMLIRTRNLVIEWEEMFQQIQTIKLERTGIALYLRGGVPAEFILITNKRERESFFKKIEEAVLKFNADRRPLD